MWKTVEIDGIKYICKYSKNEKGLECILFNLQENLLAKIDYDELYSSAKNLNKRVQFDKATIVDTLLHENIHKVIRKSEHVYRFEYRIGAPLNFEWSFSKQSDKKFKSTAVLPFIDVLECMRDRMQQLSENLQKKDAEIAQYKLEGAELRRKTVATKPFNVAKFNKQFESFKCVIQCLKEISAQEPKEPTMIDIFPSEIQSGSEKTEKATKPPKFKKRKAALRAEHQMLLVNKWNMEEKKKAMTYLNSQSQTERIESIDLTQEITKNPTHIAAEPVTCLSSDDDDCGLQETQVCAEENITERKLCIKLPKLSTDSEIIIKPTQRSPRRSLRVIEEQAQEKSKDVRISEKKHKIHESDFDIDFDDLFSWKKKKSQPDNECNETKLENLMTQLKNLNEQRLRQK